MWEAIQFVSSGVTLTAFIAAVVAWVVRTRIRREEAIIKRSTSKHRARLVESSLEFFHIKTSNLTADQQYKIALEQIKSRAHRFAIIATLVSLVAIAGLAIAIVALLQKSNDVVLNASNPISTIKEARPLAIASIITSALNASNDNVDVVTETTLDEKYMYIWARSIEFLPGVTYHLDMQVFDGANQMIWHAKNIFVPTESTWRVWGRFRMKREHKPGIWEAHVDIDGSKSVSRLLVQSPQ